MSQSQVGNETLFCPHERLAMCRLFSVTLFEDGVFNLDM